MRVPTILSGAVFLLANSCSEQNGSVSSDEVTASDEPSISIVSPVDGAEVSDVVPIEITASDDKGVVRVEILVNDTLSKTLFVPPYIYYWPVADLPDNTSHTIYAKAYDGDGNTTSTPVITVTVRLVNWMQTYANDVDISSFLEANGVLLSGVSSGILRSLDEGMTWTEIDFDEYYAGMTLVDSVVFIGGQHGRVMKSLDYGNSWEHVSYLGGMSLPGFSVVTLISVDGVLFAGCENGVFRSENLGDSWMVVGLDVPVATILSKPPYLFAGTGSFGVYRSRDNGDNWEQKNNGLITSQIDVIEAIGGGLYCGTIEGLFSSDDDGETWNGPILGSYTTSLAIENANVLAGTNRDGVFRSTDDGTTWFSMGLPISPRIPTLIATGSNIVAGLTVEAGGQGIWTRPR